MPVANRKVIRQLRNQQRHQAAVLVFKRSALVRQFRSVTRQHVITRELENRVAGHPRADPGSRVTRDQGYRIPRDLMKQITAVKNFLIRIWESGMPRLIWQNFNRHTLANGGISVR